MLRETLAFEPLTWQLAIEQIHMGVSKNRDTPKWMVYNGNPIKMDDLGVPLFSETPIYHLERHSHSSWLIMAPYKFATELGSGDAPSTFTRLYVDDVSFRKKKTNIVFYQNWVIMTQWLEKVAYIV